MIVDIIFVLLALVLVFAIYKLKFKNQATTIANTRINQIPVNGSTQANTSQNTQQRNVQQNRPRWAQVYTQQNNQEKVQQKRQSRQENKDSSDEQDDTHQTFADRKKQLRKQQKAKLKQQRKQALEHHLQEQKKKRQKQQEQEYEKQKIEQEKKRKEEQVYRKLVEEQQKRKKEQYDKWKGMFKVQTEGKSKQSAEVEQQKKQQQLGNILKILQKNKLSVLEDLAHKFKLSTKQLIQKIKQLQARGDVSGIIDQRGKYLVIQKNQWEAVKNYIQARGRIKKTDIMQECARIIKIPQNNQADQQMLKLIQKQNEGQL